MHNFLKILSALLCFIGLLVALYAWFIFSILFPTGHYDHTNLIKNHESNSQKIEAIRKYFIDQLPPATNVHIEFEKDELAIFHLQMNGNYDSNWQIPRNSHKADSLLNELAWSHQILDSLQEKLASANCISIAGDGTITTIGYQRFGFAMLSYKLFPKPLSTKQILAHNDSCEHIFYREHIVLEHGSGAIGSDCFPYYGRIQ